MAILNREDLAAGDRAHARMVRWGTDLGTMSDEYLAYLTLRPCPGDDLEEREIARRERLEAE